MRALSLVGGATAVFLLTTLPALPLTPAELAAGDETFWANAAHSFTRQQRFAEAGRVLEHRGWDDAALRREVGHLQAELDALWAMLKLSVSQAGETGVPGLGGSALKLVYTELYQRVAELSVRVLGRAGLSRDDVADLPAGHFVFSAMQSLSLTIAAGTSQIQRNIISERILGLPKEPR